MAVAAVLAVHDRDRARLAELIAEVPAGSMQMVIETLAAIADEGMTVAAQSADDARGVLVNVVLDLASE